MQPTSPTALAHESYDHDPDTLDLTLRMDALGVHRSRWRWGEMATAIAIVTLLSVVAFADVWMPLVGWQ